MTLRRQRYYDVDVTLLPDVAMLFNFVIMILNYVILVNFTLFKIKCKINKNYLLVCNEEHNDVASPLQERRIVT